MIKAVYLYEGGKLCVGSEPPVLDGYLYLGRIEDGQFTPNQNLSRFKVHKVQIMDELTPQELKSLVDCMKDIFFEERIDTEEAKEQSRFKFNFEEYKELVTEAVRAVTEAFPTKEKGKNLPTRDLTITSNNVLTVQAGEDYVWEDGPSQEACSLYGPSPLQGMYKDWKEKQDIAMRKTEIPPTQTLTEAEIDYFAHLPADSFAAFLKNHNYAGEDIQKALDLRNQLFVESLHAKTEPNLEEPWAI